LLDERTVAREPSEWLGKRNRKMILRKPVSGFGGKSRQEPFPFLPRLKLLIIISFALISIIQTTVGTAWAESELSWTPQARADGYSPEVETPFLVADQDRTVHALLSQNVAGAVAVTYRRWTLEGGWTDPVDVLLDPRGGLNQARVQGVHLDQAGVLHVTFFGGDDRDFRIFYSRAIASEADRATRWSAPLQVAQNAGPLSHGTLKGDDKGNLFFLYSGRQAGNGLYIIRSADSGQTWSEPTAIFLTGSLKRWATGMNAHLDEDGQLHMVWTIVNEGGNGESIYYARLESDHQTLSRSVLLAVPDRFEVTTPAIVRHNGLLFVIYAGVEMPPTRWMRMSTDGGQSWSPAVRPFPAEWQGTYGPVEFIVDSSNTLHMILGNRFGLPAIHGMWHTVWTGDRWRDLAPIVSGPLVRSLDLGQEFDPTSPRVAISQGNVLFAAWRTDPGNGRNGIWYSHAQLETPELPLVPLPTPRPVVVTPKKPVELPKELTDLKPSSLTPVGAVLFDRELAMKDPSNEDEPPTFPVDPMAAPIVSLVPITLAILIRYIRRS
jgi:hypothetical protein